MFCSRDSDREDIWNLRRPSARDEGLETESVCPAGSPAKTMSSITFDNRILNPEFAVSPVDQSGSRRRKEASHDRAQLPVRVDSSPSVQSEKIPIEGAPSPRRQESAGFHSELPTEGFAEMPGSPAPKPLIVVELRFFDREELRPDAEAARMAHLDIRI